MGHAPDAVVEEWRHESLLDPERIARDVARLEALRHVHVVRVFTASCDDQAVYNVASVVVFALTGGGPFARATSYRELMIALLSGTPDLPETAPAPTRATLARALEKDPARRFPSLAELAESLS